MRWLALGLLIMAGCSSHPDEPGPPTTRPSTVADADLGTTLDHPDVGFVLNRLVAAGATDPVVTTPETDPVMLLGRPGQYLERATFALPGGEPVPNESGDRGERGGVVEVWPDEASARRRASFIERAQAAAGGLVGTEYHYVRRGVLVRVSGRIAPAVANRVAAAVAALP